MECTFKPQINHRRDNSSDEKDGSCDRFEQLFLDAEIRRRRQAEYMQWYPEGLAHKSPIFKVYLKFTIRILILIAMEFFRISKIM